MPVINGTIGAKLHVGETAVSKAYRGITQVFAADVGVGGLLSVEIGADGWYADLTFKGQTAGGTYDFGLVGTSNYDPAVTTPRLVLTVTSLGFTEAGLPTTHVRTVYGTKQVRKAWSSTGDHLTNTETVDGDTVKVRVALSEYVFAKDKAGAGNSGTDVQVQVLPGLYTVDGVASTSGTLTATNNSTAPYPKVVGNWTWPGLEKAGATINARMTAFHQSGQQGKPVRAVRFTATGVTSGAVATQTVSTPTTDLATGDAMPVVEYIAAVPTTEFTQGEVVTVRAEAIPWWGDEILDSATGPVQPTPLFANLQVVCDKDGTYSSSYVVVDPVNGVDASGVVGNGTLDPANPPAAFLTIFAAANALRTFNGTTYNRLNRAGSTIYLRAGNHAWTGGTVTADSVAAETWVTVTRFPTDTRSSVAIASQSGGKNIGLYQRIHDVTLTVESNTGTFASAAGGQMWFDQCEINSPTASRPLAYLSGAMGVHYTRCLVTTYATGMRPFGAVNNFVTLVRGNTVITAQTAITMTCVGNARTATTTSNFSMVQDVQGNVANGPFMDNVVVAFNRWTHVTTNTPAAHLGRGTDPRPHGLAVVQNLFESIGPAAQPTLQITADNSTGGPIDNVLIWNNTIVGERFSIGYDEVAAATSPPVAPSHRRYWSIKNNVADNMNTKHDLFGGSVGQSGYFANPGKTGGWPVLYGVGSSGNMFAETAGGAGSTGAIGAGGAFAARFPGLKSRQGQQFVATSTGDPASEQVSTNAFDYIAFVRRGSGTGQGTTGTGDGDYHLTSGSPAKDLARDWLLPVDLAGTARTAAGDPGVYA